jgi:hypothetical protein
MKESFFPSAVSSSLGPIPHGFLAIMISPTFISGMGAIIPFSSSLPGPTDRTRRIYEKKFSLLSNTHRENVMREI